MVPGATNMVSSWDSCVPEAGRLLRRVLDVLCGRPIDGAYRLRGARHLIAELAQPVEGLALELPAALLTYAERRADLLVAARAIADQAVAVHDDLPVTLGQQAHRRPEPAPRLAVFDLLGHVGCGGVGDQLAQR